MIKNIYIVLGREFKHVNLSINLNILKIIIL